MLLLRKSDVMCSPTPAGASLAAGEHHARSAHHVPHSGTHRSKKSLLSVDKRDFFVGGEDEIRTRAPVSRPTPLAGEPLHQLGYFSVYGEKIISEFGGEEEIRTLGSCESPVFKTGSLNRSDTSPCASG